VSDEDLEPTPAPVTPEIDPGYPKLVRELADQAVAYVERAVGVRMEFDSDTLSIMDHYLRSVPTDEPAAVVLVSITGGAYFGEVVRRALGGRWDLAEAGPEHWRLVLPTGMSFAPSGIVAEAIIQDDALDLGSRFDAPAGMQPHIESALERMGEVTVEEYYSLCGRLDTLEHLQSVLLATAATLAAQQNS
jgi:hypothetical protein